MAEKKRALLSVSNKEGIVEFATQLESIGYELVSTGGTKRALEEAGLSVRSISEITDFPEIMDGRVKTLHPNVHAGLLAKRDQKEHLEQLDELHIELIDLVVVNLYPFKETISKEQITEEEAIENIDIGGPTMLRAAAKNFEGVTVIVDPNDYVDVLTYLKEETVPYGVRKQLAAKVFNHTASYDTYIANYFNSLLEEDTPAQQSNTYELVQSLRYGENPHQKASFYRDPLYKGASIANATQLNGKELSYNNIQDANAALSMVLDFNEPAAIAVKHMNPCGVGEGETVNEAFERAYEADPISIFGGIIAVNREVDRETALRMKEIFLEIVIAPSFSEEALEVLKEKKNLRLLELDLSQENGASKLVTSVRGGVLVQDTDEGTLNDVSITIPTDRRPTDQEWEDLQLAWKVVKHVKSNAIVLAKNHRTVGVGAGQMNRVGAANIAIEQAGDHCYGAAMGSDAFFPMPDTVEAAAKAGVTAIIQPGGSKRDQDSIDACNEHGITMVLTGMRHFKH
ncbi:MULTISPECIES: bifunctional phosphoribosylaminoimidazolecarboxamide formyltransferase/IMP cyclohydrolase [Pontibacillus]|uniref:Bifunctional purine biosynthesis protein PurH n=1 Tax=Pontibacillus chungwhensis TaxID=265426 RepID=A0ABY8UXS5_9BACI|nr:MULTISPECIES: bifunctional phosphoribosylaminoimidazolecarboxamide formyltransferase/IMP cyclohydrolase [Pontibacillus]MCD5325348.1 bifunctional phosphoribosylaminoimidazolecarboxamide formyltransferase/IMP cyclohydrolase [Pontibacillus sp. HN14]WIF98466.1 bifunctional phosphoribosylaminoimidazolecarboxamide formyltransferase/IMP cyclohydrolase [Pontibacillus chungwhensis]